MAIKVKTHVPPTPGKYAEHLETKPVKATSEVTVKNNLTKKETVLSSGEEVLNPGMFTSGPGFVKPHLFLTVEGGRTINLGNYESATVKIRLSAPTSMEELNTTFEWETEWISDKLNAAIEEAKGQLNVEDKNHSATPNLAPVQDTAVQYNYQGTKAE